MSDSRYYLYRLTVQSGRKKPEYLLKVNSRSDLSVVNSKGLELALIRNKPKEKLYLATIKKSVHHDDSYITLIINRFGEPKVHGSGNKKVTLEKIFNIK